MRRDPMTMPASPGLEPTARQTTGRETARELSDRRLRSPVSRRFAILMAGMLVIAFAAPAPAQQTAGPQTGNPSGKSRSASPPAPIRGTIHIASPLVVVSFTAADPSGDFVYDLNKNEVRVLDNGVPQQIRHFGMASQPTAAVIVVEADGRTARYMNTIHPLGPLFSDMLLGREGQAAVLTYGDQVTLMEAFSSDPSKLEKSLEQIRGAGKKARLNDALAQAVRMLSHEDRADRRIVIVFSDGSDRGSATKGAQIIRAACDANVQIYGVRFQPAKEAFENGADELSKVIGPTVPPPGGPVSVRSDKPTYDFVPFAVLAMKVMRAQLRKNKLGTYSGFTGGSVYTPFKTHSFQDMLQQIALDVNSEYVLTYVPSTLEQQGFHHIQLEVSRPRLKVHARPGYFYGAPAS